LEFAPLKVSGSIRSSVNFDGQVHIELKMGPPQMGGGIDLSD